MTEVFNYPILSDMAAWVTTDIESAEYKRFSLVSPEERSSVLRCLLSDVSVGKILDVLDILPTTDLQAQFVRENMASERRQLNYFAFDASGPCDISGLISAVSDLVIRIESPRTGFART
jgi:hypothetical protein